MYQSVPEQGIFVGLFPNFLSDNFLNALNIETKTVYLFGGIILGLGGELISMLAYISKRANSEQLMIREIRLKKYSCIRS